jgi:hypothetical protein
MQQQSSGISRQDAESAFLGPLLVGGFFGFGAGVFYAIHEYVVMGIFLAVLVLAWLIARHQIHHPSPPQPPERPDSGYGAFTPAQQAEIHAKSLAFAAAHPTRARVQQGIAMIIGIAAFLAVPALLVWAWTGH